MPSSNLEARMLHWIDCLIGFECLVMVACYKNHFVRSFKEGFYRLKELEGRVFEIIIDWVPELKEVTEEDELCRPSHPSIGARCLKLFFFTRPLSKLVVLDKHLRAAAHRPGEKSPHHLLHLIS